MEALRASRAYWICQISGWCAYSGLNFAVVATSPPMRSILGRSWGVGLLMMVPFGIAITLGLRELLRLRSLAQLEQRLDPKHFFRAGRKHVVNLRHIEGVTPWMDKGLRVRLRGGHEVEMSRRQTQAFKEKLGI